MTRVLCASSAAAVALLAAAIDTGAVAGRIVLLIANEADIPEIVTNPWEIPGFDRLVTRVDEVVHLNEFIAPLHPTGWRPSPPEIPVLARLLAARLAPDDEIEELVVESVTAGPGRALAELVPDVSITIASHTLDAYGPPVVQPTSEVAGRVTRLLHLDLVPMLRARFHHDAGMSTETVPVSAFRTAFTGSAAAQAPFAVVLGERYAEVGLLPADDEHALRVDTIRAVAAAGHTDIVFAPHPASGPMDPAPLVDAALAAGARLTIGPAGLPHEVWTLEGSALVVGTASPALFLAPRAATLGCRRLLDLKLRYDRPDRMALTIADAGLSHLEPDGSLSAPTADLAHLVDAVAFCLAPSVLPELRDRAGDWVAQYGVPPYLRPSLLRTLGILEESSSRSPLALRGRTRRLAGRAHLWLGSHSGGTQP